MSKDQWEVSVKQGHSPAAKKAIEFVISKKDDLPKLKAPAFIKEEPAAAVEVEEPKKRPEKKAAEPTQKKDLKAIMGDWSKEPT